MSDIQRYVVETDMLADKEIVGTRTYKDTTIVVTMRDHLTAMQQQRDTALREALALVRERETDLLSCHKDDECRAYARIAGVIADDIQSELIDGGDTR